MILETDFLDHWKTRLLAELLGDEMAHTYIMRLWFHCQTRKAVYFDGMTSQILKVVCRYPGDGEKLKSAMSEAGFIVVQESAILVPKFAETNSKMVANWENGEKTRLRFADEKAKGGPTEGQTTATGGADGRGGRLVGKEGKEEVGRGGDADLPTDLPSGIPTQTVSEKAAEAYQRRRYKKPKPDADYYPALLREADEVFADNPNAEKMLAAFIAQCGVPFSKMPERATFSELCVAAGIKQLKPPSRGGGGTVEEKEQKLLLAAQKALQYSRSINQHESDFLAYGNVPREYKLKALELEKQNGSAA